MHISELVDYPAIRQIGEALWNTGDVRGAAVMVGAGFSRLATLNDSTLSLPPLWSDFSKKMEERLYPTGGAPSNPLRLAQEYKAALGSSALNGLIASLIQDEKWSPSDLHRTLLALPWADVLTTNWDTLLERTELLDTEKTYEIVRSIEDITKARSPRIVKLHGSLPSNRPFIFTEEDYRTYPRNFAPFVNLAQQVLLENELCLLGFSGDDPNFLQWAGWVRDNLGGFSRQVRLIGVLNLSPSRREMLKQQNVTTIDLAPLVDTEPDDTKHEAAISLFLECLGSFQPPAIHKWDRPSGTILSKPTKPDDPGPEIHKLAEAWQEDRLSHPGFLVTPWQDQERLRRETAGNFLPLASIRAATDPKVKLRYLFELACRHELSFWPLHPDYAKEMREAYSADGRSFLSQKETIQLSAFLSAEARRRWDWETFEFWTSQLEEIDCIEARAEFTYQQALRSKAEFDLERLTTLTAALNGPDPIWKMRQGMLYATLFAYTEAAQCYEAAYNEIRRRRALDKRSIWLLSREAWSNFVYQRAWSELPENEGKYYKDFGAWPNRYIINDCDPWEYLSCVDSKSSEEFQEHVERRRDTVSLFDPGHYRDNSGNTKFVNHVLVDSIEFYKLLQETVGLPSRTGFTNFLSTRLEEAFSRQERRTEADYFLAAGLVVSYDKKLIDIAFSRIEVTKIPGAIVLKLASKLRQSCDFLLQQKILHTKRTDSIEQVRRNLQIISRLCIRMAAEQARDYFAWALNLCHDKSAYHWWLFEHIGDVLCRSLEAIPVNERGTLAESAFFLPLPGDLNLSQSEREWPELSEVFDDQDFARLSPTPKLSLRIEELIQAVRSDHGLNSDRAILRLSALHKAGLLTESEQEKLADATWSSALAKNEWPKTQTLYPFFLFKLPIIHTQKTNDLFVSIFLKPVLGGQISHFSLNNLLGAFENSEALFDHIGPNLAQLLFLCLSWKPQEKKDPFSQSFIEGNNKAIATAIADFLSDVVLPQITAEAIPQSTQKLWLDQILGDQNPKIIKTAAYYVRVETNAQNQIVNAIRKAIYSRHRERVAFGFHAIGYFIEIHEKQLVEIPTELISDVVSTCESMREPGLFHALSLAVGLVTRNLLSEEYRQRLGEIIPFIWSEFGYEEQINEDRMVTLTLVRSECIKLANALQNSSEIPDSVQEVLDQAKDDPLPEVRFAV